MGRDIVADLAADHKVYALGRNQAELDALVAEHGDAMVPLRADLVAEMGSGADAGKETADNAASGVLADGALAALAELDEVHTLVHAAAIAHNHSVESATVADWQAHFDINVTAPAWLTQQLLPALRRGGATVVFINSGAGRNTSAGNVVYCASKHALYALADGLRKGELDLRVSTVAPGPTDTAMFKGLQGDYNPEHVIAPVEVARAIRAVVDAGPTTQLTEVQVRPRIELADRAARDAQDS